jgi:hypothetical protein
MWSSFIRKNIKTTKTKTIYWSVVLIKKIIGPTWYTNPITSLVSTFTGHAAIHPSEERDTTAPVDMGAESNVIIHVNPFCRFVTCVGSWGRGCKRKSPVITVTGQKDAINRADRSASCLLDDLCPAMGAGVLHPVASCAALSNHRSVWIPRFVGGDLCLTLG